MFNLLRFTRHSVKLALSVTLNNSENIIGTCVLFIASGWGLNLLSHVSVPEIVKTIIFAPLRMSYSGWSILLNGLYGLTPIKWSFEGWVSLWNAVSS